MEMMLHCNFVGKKYEWSETLIQWIVSIAIVSTLNVFKQKYTVQ